MCRMEGPSWSNKEKLIDFPGVLGVSSERLARLVFRDDRFLLHEEELSEPWLTCCCCCCVVSSLLCRDEDLRLEDELFNGVPVGPSADSDDGEVVVDAATDATLCNSFSVVG